VTARRAYPPALRLDLVEEIHGNRVADPYRWLEDVTDPAARAWAAAQDELYRHERQGWRWRDQIRERLTELSAVDQISPPRPRGGRMFFTHRPPGQDHPVLMVAGTAGTWQPVLDPLVLDPSGHTTLEGWQPSIEGDRLAYQLAVGGTEESLLRVCDVDSGEVVDGPIDRVRRSPVAWLPGGAAFYYVRRLDPDLVPEGERRYHRRVYLHRVGTDAREDVEVFGAGGGAVAFYSVGVTPDGRWLTVSASDGAARRNDLWLADLSRNGPRRPEFVMVQGGVDAHTVACIRAGTGPASPMFLMTYHEAALGRVVAATPAHPRPESWRGLVAEDPEAVLVDTTVLDGSELNRPVLLATRARHTVSEITVHDLTDGAPLGTVPLPGLGSVRQVTGRPEGGHEAWFGYTDFVTPPTVYRYDGRAHRTERWTVPGVTPGGTTGHEVKARQVCYPSTGGCQVSMFVISRSEYPDRPRPTILTGYGGFGTSMAPTYSPMAVAWVEAGGVYAVAGLRGGAEEGEDWHRAGTREHKQNVFDDLHAAADWLVAQGWTSAGKLGVLGGSNGGLLAGAALTQHPEKYAAVVCAAPLLDMVRYERWGLGPSWSREYGSAADAVEFGWLLSYSPYHHVQPGTSYPAVLFTVFDGDTRVDPLHARKMCAALQHATRSERPILIRAESGVGHGLRALSREIDLGADILAFFCAELGLAPVGIESGRIHG
jgi:prolyl oligopeptidase